MRKRFTAGLLAALLAAMAAGHGAAVQAAPSRDVPLNRPRLLRHGVTPAQIDALDAAALVVQAAIERHGAGAAAVQGLVAGLLHPAFGPARAYPVAGGQVVYPDGSRLPLPRLPGSGADSLAAAAGKGGGSSIPTCPIYAGTGAYWEVNSVTGYAGASGYAQTPPEVSITDNDVPYMFFGAKTTTGAVDAGVFLRRRDGAWKVFVNTGGNRWAEATLAGSPGPGSRFFLVFGVQADTVTIRVFDAAGATLLGGIQAAVPPAYGFAPRAPDLRVYKVTSMAQFTENLANGSSFRGARWSGVHLYGGRGYGPLDTRRTGCTAEYPAAPAPDRVFTTVLEPFNEDLVDIVYQ